MKNFLLVFIFIGFTLQGFKYQPSIGIKGSLPIEISYLEMSLKCGMSCMGEIQGNFGYGVFLNNDFKLNNSIAISLNIAYQYGLIEMSKSHALDFEDSQSEIITDYKYKSNLIKLTPSIKYFHTKNIYSNYGLSYDIYLNTPSDFEIRELSKFGINLGIGYLFNNIGVEFSIEGLKMIDTTVKGRSYINTSLAVFYTFK
jgi:hypothetical protein